MSVQPSELGEVVSQVVPLTGGKYIAGSGVGTGKGSAGDDFLHPAKMVVYTSDNSSNFFK